MGKKEMRVSLESLSVGKRLTETLGPRLLQCCVQMFARNLTREAFVALPCRGRAIRKGVCLVQGSFDHCFEALSCKGRAHWKGGLRHNKEDPATAAGQAKKQRNLRRQVTSSSESQSSKVLPARSLKASAKGCGLDRDFTKWVQWRRRTCSSPSAQAM